MTPFLNHSLKIAIRHEDITQVKNLIRQGANNFNAGLIEACDYGKVDIVKLMIEHKATNINHHYILDKAYEQNYVDVVKEMLKHKTYPNNDLNSLCSCYDDNRLNDDDDDDDLKYRLKIPMLYIERGINVENLLLTACVYGKLNIAKLAIQHGAIDIFPSIQTAYNYCHNKIILPLFAYFANFTQRHKQLELYETSEPCLQRIIYPIIARHKKARELIVQTIDDLNVKYYDLNISDIIINYIPYE